MQRDHVIATSHDISHLSPLTFSDSLHYHLSLKGFFLILYTQDNNVELILRCEHKIKKMSSSLLSLIYSIFKIHSQIQYLNLEVVTLKFNNFSFGSAVVASTHRGKAIKSFVLRVVHQEFSEGRSNPNAL